MARTIVAILFCLGWLASAAPAAERDFREVLGFGGKGDLGDTKRIYYEGDPGGLEIGCGFQGGEWSTP